MDPEATTAAEEGELIEEAAPTAGAKFTSPSPRASTTSRSNVLARRKWLGCSSLGDFDLAEKVGEGTFGYGPTLWC